MKPEFCRRRFVAHSFALAGCAALLPARRLSAATTSLIDSVSPPQAPQDSVHRTAFALVGAYGLIESVTIGHDATQIAVRVHSFGSMARTLGAAREHGVASVRAVGNITAFELEGRRFEIENRAPVR